MKAPLLASTLALGLLACLPGCRQDTQPTANPKAEAAKAEKATKAKKATPPRPRRRPVADGKAARLIEAVRKGEARLTQLPEGTPKQLRNLEQGKAMLQAGDKEAAAAHFEAASYGDVTGARVSALLALGDLERERGRTAETVRLHEQAGNIAPGVPEVQLQLGRAYLLVGRTKDAEKALRQAVNMEPRLLAGWVDLGGLLAKTGRADEAARTYLKYEKYLFDLVRRLKAGDDSDRLVAVDALSLAAGDDKAVVALAEALSDPSAPVRAAAATALGDSGVPAAAPALATALTSERSEEVRRALTQASARLRAAGVK